MMVSVQLLVHRYQLPGSAQQLRVPQTLINPQTKHKCLFSLCSELTPLSSICADLQQTDASSHLLPCSPS